MSIFKIELYKDRTTVKSQRKKTTTTTTPKPVTANGVKNGTKESAVDEPASSQKISTFSQEAKTEKAINATDTVEAGDDTKQAKVDVPQHIIYMLLIGELIQFSKLLKISLNSSKNSTLTFHPNRTHHSHFSCTVDRCMLST